MSPPPPDVVILGAGPAGSAAAIRLARAGRRVLVLEKTVFPRDKVCGGCLSGRAVAMLGRLLPNTDLPGVPGSRITFTFGRHTLHCRSDGRTRIVLRRELDLRLAAAALAAGAEIRFGTPARLEHRAARFVVTADNETWSPPHVLLACGLGGTLRSLDIPAVPARRRLLAQEWLQPPGAEAPPLGGVDMHWLTGGYIGLARPAPDCVLVALAAETPPAGTHVWPWLRRRNPRAAVWPLLAEDAPRRFRAHGAAGFPWSPRVLGAANLLLVGDVAGYEEPFTGEGIGQALTGGWWAAQAILDANAAQTDPLPLYTNYLARYSRPALRRLRLLGALLRTPWLPSVAAFPPLLPPAVLNGLLARVHVQT